MGVFYADTVGCAVGTIAVFSMLVILPIGVLLVTYPQFGRPSLRDRRASPRNAVARYIARHAKARRAIAASASVPCTGLESPSNAAAAAYRRTTNPCCRAGVQAAVLLTSHVDSFNGAGQAVAAEPKSIVLQLRSL